MLEVVKPVQRKVIYAVTYRWSVSHWVLDASYRKGTSAHYSSVQSEYPPMHHYLHVWLCISTGFRKDAGHCFLPCSESQQDPGCLLLFHPISHLHSPGDSWQNRTCPAHYFPKDSGLCLSVQVSHSFQPFEFLNKAPSPIQVRCLLDQNDAVTSSPSLRQCTNP